MSKKEQNTDPRVARTRKWFRDALFELIHEKGYENITVQNIADRATLNRATFYLHYRDKHDLLYQSSEEILNGLAKNLHSSKSAAEKIDFRGDQPPYVFIQLFEYISLNSDFFEVVLVEKKIPAITSGMIDVIAEFISEGIFIIAPDDDQLVVPRKILIAYISSAFLGVIGWWLENDMPYTPKYMATKLMRLALKGPYKNDPF
ncbi:TetR/AcrR family transcriptional regulator [Lentibacillus sp. L22]|uniref:TetR/AcrR family transcriptional regulator n=1 Tax=Lentibacillus TaxID=175304 RepID=UPI0022B1E91E|nr:TetR/AcrR family transcriptional regulator [Lentibacillus daqui]